MNFFKNVLKGTIIGAGAILPGISSGVLCVIFGIYDTLLNSVLNFFKDIKQNFKFLFPIAIGGIIGMILLGNILKYLFYAYPIQTNFTFIGLILGSVPALLKQINSNKPFRLHYLIYLILSFSVGIFLVFLENNISLSSTNTEYSYIFLIFCGFIMSAGVVIPGVSSTLILMLAGIYSSYLTAVSTLYLPFLIPMAIGLLIGSIFCMKLIKFLLDRFYAQTFYCIVGFTIGSIFVLYPGFSFDITGVISLLSLFFGIVISSIIST